MSAPDLQRLRCFLAVAEEMHFARAAARLNMTPPPLSRQIKQLEREIGGELFVRGYHQIELTPLGERLVEPVRRAIQGVDAIGDLANELAATGSPLRIGATPFAPGSLLDEFLRILDREGIQAHDEVTLEQGSYELAKRVSAGSLDLALVFLPSPDDSLLSAVWRRFDLAIAVRSDDPLAGAESLTLDDLRGRKLVHPLGRLHAKLWEEHRSRLANAGIDVLDLPAPVGLAEIATQVWSRQLIAFIPAMGETVFGRVFSSPEFATIPVRENALSMELGFVWSPESKASPGVLRRALGILTNAADAEAGEQRTNHGHVALADIRE